MTEIFDRWMGQLFELFNVPELFRVPILTGLELALIVLLTAVVYFVAKLVVKHVVVRIVRATSAQWDDDLLESGFLWRFCKLIAAVVFYALVVLLVRQPEWFSVVMVRIAAINLIFRSVRIVVGALDLLHEAYVRFDRAQKRPLKSWLQIAKIIVWVVGLVLMVTVVIDRSPVAILGSLGALSAVLLIVFKDTLLGFIAGIQISSTDLIRIGDWLEIPKHGADGDVIDISLLTVRVRNWDKTIVSVPIYALVSESFTNWRGMAESGGRRIKRAIHIDMESVRFCTPEMLEQFKRFTVVRGWIEERERQIDRHNRALDAGGAGGAMGGAGTTAEPAHGASSASAAAASTAVAGRISGRRMTNLGIFRSYAYHYLQQHPNVHDRMTCMVRQLSPGKDGIPLEIYAFCNDQRWEVYEGIQADIFDHLIAIIPAFELRIFQSPGGSDVREGLRPLYRGQ